MRPGSPSCDLPRTIVAGDAGGANGKSAWSLAPSWLARYGSAVRSQRRCSRNGCTEPAVATLTYVYADSTAVLGPLATFPEPHTYDLCELHARRMTAPRGWELVRHEGDFETGGPNNDDLAALADAVREAAKPASDEPDEPPPPGKATRRGHLRAVPSSN